MQAIELSLAGNFFFCLYLRDCSDNGDGKQGRGEGVRYAAKVPGFEPETLQLHVMGCNCLATRTFPGNRSVTVLMLHPATSRFWDSLPQQYMSTICPELLSYKKCWL